MLCTQKRFAERFRVMRSKTILLSLVLATLALGMSACSSTPESTAGGAPGTGVYTEGSTLGNDPGSLMVGGAGPANGGNGGGIASTIGSH